MAVKAVEVEEFLNMKYPVKKMDIIQQAKKNGASSDMIKVLEEIPDKEYTNAEEVSKELHQKHKKLFGISMN